MMACNVGCTAVFHLKFIQHLQPAVVKPLSSLDQAKLAAEFVDFQSCGFSCQSSSTGLLVCWLLDCSGAIQCRALAGSDGGRPSRNFSEHLQPAGSGAPCANHAAPAHPGSSRAWCAGLCQCAAPHCLATGLLVECQPCILICKETQCLRAHPAADAHMHNRHGWHPGLQLVCTATRVDSAVSLHSCMQVHKKFSSVASVHALLPAAQP